MEIKKISVPKLQTPTSKKTKKGKPEPVINYEDAAGAEIAGYNKALRETTLKEQKYVKDAVSSGFWFAVYFADTEQRDEFIKNAKIEKKMESQYFNGEQFADALGVKITKKKISPPKAFRKHKNLTGFSL